MLADAPIVGLGRRRRRLDRSAGSAWSSPPASAAAPSRRANRNAALGVTAFATMGRVWLLAGAILLVGLLDEREAGLAAALLALVLVTVHLGASVPHPPLRPRGRRQPAMSAVTR